MNEGASLLGRLMAVYGAALVLVAILLLASPITIDAPPSAGQAAAVVGGLAAILAAVYFVVRRVLAPLQRLVHEGRENARVALAAQERERLRVARELHDEIGQNLTAITLDAERSAEDEHGDAAAALRRVAEDIRYTLDEVRRVARELRPEALDDLGLVNALITLCARVGESGLQVERRLANGLPPLEAETELVIYRIAQESLTNVVRHARAERVELVLAADAETVTLVVRDDGAGLPSRVPRDAYGIAGMRERALLVGGTLDVASEPGSGTEVRLEMPIEAGPR